jgi:hypothetical protein
MARSNPLRRSGAKMPLADCKRLAIRKPPGASLQTARSHIQAQRSLAFGVPGPVVTFTIDYGLIALGIGAAIGSAAFATYMIAQNSGMIAQNSGAARLERAALPAGLAPLPARESITWHYTQARGNSRSTMLQQGRFPNAMATMACTAQRNQLEPRRRSSTVIKQAMPIPYDLCTRRWRSCKAPMDFL